jgi:hypothetical protein
MVAKMARTKAPTGLHLIAQVAKLPWGNGNMVPAL